MPCGEKPCGSQPARLDNYKPHSAGRKVEMQWEDKTITLANNGFLGRKLDVGKLDAFVNNFNAEG